jgi:hypothetical protein
MQLRCHRGDAPKWLRPNQLRHRACTAPDAHSREFAAGARESARIGTCSHEP